MAAHLKYNNSSFNHKLMTVNNFAFETIILSTFIINLPGKVAASHVERFRNKFQINTLNYKEYFKKIYERRRRRGGGSCYYGQPTYK